MLSAWPVLCLTACIVAARAEDVTQAWRLAAPPEALQEGVEIPETPVPSVFSSKGDGLVDLSKALRAEETFGQGAWLVWNSTRRLLIARGNRYTLDRADLRPFLQEPHLAGISLAWYRGIAPGDPLPAGAKPVYRSEVIDRPGFKSDTRWEVSGAGTLGEIDVEAEPILTDDRLAADIRLAVDWKEAREGGPLKWRFMSSFLTETSRDRERVISQVVSPTGESWTVTVKARDLLLDGSPAETSCLREVAGKAEFVRQRTPDHLVHRLGTVTVQGSLLTVAELDLGADEARGIFKTAGYDVPEEPQNPFDAAERGGIDVPRPAACQDAVIPDGLREFAPVTMWDLKPPLVKLGLPLADGDYAAFDPRLRRLVVASKDAESLRHVEDLLMPMCNLPPPLNLTATFRGVAGGEANGPVVAGARLLVRSGQKQVLTCEDQNENLMLSFEVEPELKENGQILELRHELDLDGFPTLPGLAAKGKLTVVKGRETPFGTAETGERKITLSMKVDVDPVVIERER
ncbi:hypothetical protein [Luteolibacter sp. LG18]|uniref:hypothetical protein n=1 Tax=Luteolibacter sp. LG18 TaxID=2819286 RepID=UPI002B2A12E3|nr:hypothetical protein llg_10350 [Luteolibacter sp. LG18]